MKWDFTDWLHGADGNVAHGSYTQCSSVWRVLLDSAGDLLRRVGPGLLAELLWEDGPPFEVLPFITRHSVNTDPTHQLQRLQRQGDWDSQETSTWTNWTTHTNTRARRHMKPCLSLDTTLLSREPGFWISTETELLRPTKAFRNWDGL